MMFSGRRTQAVAAKCKRDMPVGGSAHCERTGQS
jgi:hypothetical protein